MRGTRRAFSSAIWRNVPSPWAHDQNATSATSLSISESNQRTAQPARRRPEEQAASESNLTNRKRSIIYTAPTPPPPPSPPISSGCCTAGVCGQCEWESKRGPVGQQRWFLCKAEPGGLYCLSVFNGIRFSTKNRWQSKILN